MIPPEPTRIFEVAPATWPIITEVAALAMPVMLWCSANQNRLKPSFSASMARERVLRNESEGVPPATTGDKSSTDNGISESFLIYISLHALMNLYRYIDGRLCACQTSRVATF